MHALWFLFQIIYVLVFCITNVLLETIFAGLRERTYDSHYSIYLQGETTEPARAMKNFLIFSYPCIAFVAH